MLKKMSILAVIPARGGSKGIPGKNIKKLSGKPLIAYTIEQARASKYIDRIVVSTDDDAIANVARRYGAEVPFMRPKSLARDTSGMMGVLIHALTWAEQRENRFYDMVVLLQPTSPLRTADDIDKCVKLLANGSSGNVFAVTEPSTNPYYAIVEKDARGNIRKMKKGAFVTRQSAPQVFAINGAVYVWRTSLFRKRPAVVLPNSTLYFMPKSRSIDIDDDIDLKLAELLLREKRSYGKKR
jgi:N-acylneuraminate cytidylyltransferase/CMP-N,N'-diacetyllegionaminic acid synthase